MLGNYTGKIGVSLLNTFGKVVLSANVEIDNSQSFRISTQHIKPGIYLLSIYTAHQVLTKKVVISR